MNDTVIGTAVFLVLFGIQMVIGNFQPSERPEPFFTVFVKLLADQKLMQRLKIYLACLLLAISLVHLGALESQAQDAREDCRICGMWIDQYMHTRHVLTEADGTKVSFCSFTCAAKHLRGHEAGPEQLQVADYLSAELVHVNDAYYLLESDAPPVMSFTSIIAFASKEAAENFQKLHGGKIMKFDEVFTRY